jgi:SOS response regulatory protein OraA/RecX
MYFGEFLINKKIINEEQLLDALTYQVEKLPSFLRVLRDFKIFSSSEIIKIIQTQIENNSDLLSVLKKENILDDKKLADIYKTQLAGKKMLGEALVELRFVEQRTIENMLNEFLRNKENRQEALLSNEPANLVQNVQEIEISDAALESLRELGLSDEEFIKEKPGIVIKNEKESSIFIDEFLSIFNSKMKEKLLKLTALLKNSANENGEISNYLNSLYKDVLTLKGASNLASLNVITSTLEELGQGVEKVLSLQSDQQSIWVRDAIPVIEKVIDFLWQVREVTLTENGDECIINMPELHGDYVKLISALKNYS